VTDGFMLLNGKVPLYSHTVHSTITVKLQELLLFLKPVVKQTVSKSPCTRLPNVYQVSLINTPWIRKLTCRDPLHLQWWCRYHTYNISSS